MNKYYIAYGSNMDESQMAYRCPDAKLLGAGKLMNYELLFKGSKTGCYATIEERKCSEVPVLVWEISKADEDRLDVYEGYPNFYYKKELPLNINGKELTAMVYVMHEDRELGLPSKFYYNILLFAYRRFGFDESILRTALERSRKENDDVWSI